MEKIAPAEPSLALDETVLKWYDIGAKRRTVPLAIRALARRACGTRGAPTRSATG